MFTFSYNCAVCIFKYLTRLSRCIVNMEALKQWSTNKNLFQKPFLPSAECDGTQNVKLYQYFFPVPNISNTDTRTFFGTKFFRYWFRDFFRNQIFLITVQIPPKIWEIPCTGTYPVQTTIKNLNFGDENQGSIFDTSSKTFSGTNSFRYRFRACFLAPIFSATSSNFFSDTTEKMKNFWYLYVTLWPSVLKN